VSLFLSQFAFVSPVNAKEGWEPFSPRPEISPQFKFSKREVLITKGVGLLSRVWRRTKLEPGAGIMR
jgi:hypothetical protein